MPILVVRVFCTNSCRTSLVFAYSLIFCECIISYSLFILE